VLTLAGASRQPQVAHRSRAFLPEVQALRALAVMLVVLYHFWPNRLRGGYVGVDVFFVISGFLITSHLHREVVDRGRVSLSRFYARRARRLLPAALLVLFTTGVASFAFLPATRWAANAGEILASTLYVQNWRLAARAVDYSASAAAASAVQHFWSLSVEEQFYLAWPPLILLLLAIARRTRIRRDSLLLGGIVVVTAASLGWSVYATATDPAGAYFVTPTRIWELGAGAVLALARAGRAGKPAGHRSPRPAPAIALRWGGLLAIAASAVLLTAASPFPGYLALLPVVGTVAVIAAGDTGSGDPTSALMALPPVQFLGDISYSLYLWHWPFLVMAPFALGHPLPAMQKVGLLGICIALAWATKVCVEDPTQRWRALVRPTSLAVFTVAAMLAVSGVSALQWHEVGKQEDAARARLAVSQQGPCFGAAARHGAGCSNPFGPPASLTLTPDDQPWFHDPACTVTLVPVGVATCQFSSEPPARTVALVGDSHAEHWRGALHRIAKELNWKIVELLKGACPVSEARVVGFNDARTDGADCRTWNRKVSRFLADEHPDYIFTSSWAAAMTFDGGHESGVRGFADTWTGWVKAGARVFVLRDVPATGHRDIPECLVTHPGAPTACARPRSEALVPDALTEAVGHVHSDRIRLIDLSDFFCDTTTCYAAIGGALVYWDRDHMSAQFSRSLAPYLLDRIGIGTG
jgi:peptidoglycan/LPS O-acetylase OafA/YrhL